MDYHFPMLTLEQAAQEGMRLFGAQPKSVHCRICAASLTADSIDDALRKIAPKTAGDRIDADNCESFLRDQMGGRNPHEIDKYTDRPEREIRNPFPNGLKKKRQQLELAI